VILLECKFNLYLGNEKKLFKGGDVARRLRAEKEKDAAPTKAGRPKQPSIKN
jgi:hypothetical protein